MILSKICRRLQLPLFLALVAAAPGPALAASFDRARLDAAFHDLAGKSVIPAFGVIGVEADGQEYAFFHGKEVWSRERRLSADSIFRIYSMTKPIASVAAMQLVEQRKLTLDEPLDKWLPEMTAIPVLQPDGSIAKSNTPITLRHLLTHTAGFGYDFVQRRLREFKKPADWAHRDGPRLNEPGAAWNYGTNTDWVGRLIEKVAGMDLETYLQKYVTGPLGMKRTFFVVPDALQDDIVSMGKLVGGESPRMVESKEERRQVDKPQEFSAGGGLFSTARDYTRFVRMVLNGGRLDGVQILRRETLELMLQNQIGDKFTGGFGVNDKFGLAWAINVQRKDGGRSIGSVYWAGAANTYFSIDLKRGRSVMLFTNFLPMVSESATSLLAEAEQLLYK